jgi:leucyl-tRNA synthetase
MAVSDGDATGPAPEGTEYDIRAISAKWLAHWEANSTFVTRDDDPRPRKYVLDMFPYPSGDLHMGHAEAFAFGDIVARYWRQRGFNVLHPIGWDSFGLPAENAAIQRGANPVTWTYDNIAQQRESFRRYGVSFDWSRVLHTSDPEYYKWNQWLFLQLFERGLAYQKEGWVNWDPVDQTVLANEQVLPDGTSERTGALVEKKKLTQWYFKVTDYADRLLDDLNQLEGAWPSRVLQMQRNWIGRSIGADVDFEIEGKADRVTVFTTRPDTLYGATFMVVAPDSDLAAELVAGAPPEIQSAFAVYLEQTGRLTEIERQDTERPKTGVPLGRTAINPLTGERLPIWSSDYVLADYGHGAIMAVPAHDQRDLDFARRFDLPVRVVVDTFAPVTGAMPVVPIDPVTGEPIFIDDAEPIDPNVTGIALAGDGRLVNSGPLDGLSKQNAIKRAIEILEDAGRGRAAKNFRLRDWLISRQRFWGTPIPIIHGADGALVPVPVDQLPVVLPPTEGLDLKPKGQSPLGAATNWVQVPDPRDGSPALRDTDTMDTFVDSSWYFLRFLSPGDDTKAFDVRAADQWAPVDQYVGGVEHAILHLLYARFVTKVLFDMGLVSFTEPFSALLNQGMVLGDDGRKLSKRSGQGVTFAGQLEEHGADALRLALAFAGPPEDNINWADVQPAAAARFLGRAFRLATEVTSSPNVAWKDGNVALRRATHRFLADGIQLAEALKFNVMVARVMELVNVTRRTLDATGGADPAVREAVEVITVALSMFAPFTAEEMWARLGYVPSVATAGWRKADPALLIEDVVTAVVTVDGKVRDRLEVPAKVGEAELESLARASANTVRAIGDREVVKVIVRAPNVVNIVTRG